MRTGSRWRAATANAFCISATMTIAARFTRWWRTIRDIAGPVIAARIPIMTITMATSKRENPLSPRGVAFLLELGAILNASMGAAGLRRTTPQLRCVLFRDGRIRHVPATRKTDRNRVNPSYRALTPKTLAQQFDRGEDF